MFMGYLLAPRAWLCSWGRCTHADQHKLQLSSGEKGMMGHGKQTPSPPPNRGSPLGPRQACGQGAEHVHGTARREKLVLQLPRQYL